MAGFADEKLLRYYGQELSYLRQAGALFARQYPKIAHRLDLHKEESVDPHVERLLESFAFLTARLQRDIDENLPQISSALLSMLYPHLVKPIPSLAIAQFEIDPNKGKLTDGAVLPRHLPLLCLSHEGVACRFKTCYEVKLWPITLEQAEIISTEEIGVLPGQVKSPQVLKLRFHSLGIPLQQLSLSSLRFYVQGERQIVKRIYELLAQEDPSVFIRGDNNRRLKNLPPASCRFVGFDEEEAVLPLAPSGDSAYRLLQEYFVFPQKFSFLEVQNISLADYQESFEIFLTLSGTVSTTEKTSINASNFLLGCTPIINLFDRLAEPIRLDHFQTEYRLSADHRRERTTEIYEVRKVNSAIDDSSNVKAYAPYFSLDHHVTERQQAAFWVAKRKPTLFSHLKGTDLYLSFVDLEFNPTQPVSETVFAHVTCTNRGLAEQLAPHTALQLESSGPTVKITCLDRPTPQREAPSDAESQWRLVSNLSLNYLSLQATHGGEVALREMLAIYAGYGGTASLQELAALKSIHFSKIVRRLRREAWRGFAQGVEVTLTLDENEFIRTSPLLFGAVLDHFFQRYVTVNSFSELVIKSTLREGDWRRWSPQQGVQAYL